MLHERGTKIDGTAVTPTSYEGPLTSKTDLGDTNVLRSFPSQLIYAELQRRDEEAAKPVCGSSGRRGSYNTPLHVAALFIILILSTFGRMSLFTHPESDIELTVNPLT